MTDWSRIPTELRERPQWCLAGQNKRPLTADGRPASVTDPATWTDFDTASRSAAARSCSIGYVQTADDPYSCIDMDAKDGTAPETLERYQSIIDQFDSYTEHSQSGRGFHVWVRGKIGDGKRRDGVEVYSQARFMICTGNVVRDKPIAERQAFLAQMVTQMRDTASATEPLPDGPETYSDTEILDRARSAGNGARFAAHYDGQFDRIGHTDHSRADMALITMLAFYSRNNEQVKRLFLASSLGQREKARSRKDYVDRTIRAVRASQAAGPTVEHGQEMAFAIISSALMGYLIPPVPSSTEEGGSLLDRLSIDWAGEDEADVPDIAEGLVADEEVTLLGGHGGVGKGFLALQTACAVALGEPILGCATRRCRVLYYSAEDGRKRLTRRLRRVTEMFDYNAERLRANLRVLDASETEPLYGERLEPSPDGRRFAKMMGPSADFENLRRMVEEFDPQLVIIDGASDTFDGNEIARREVRAFIKMLRRVHPNRNVGVLLIVHIDRSSARGYSTNDDGYAGSAQWHNSCRRRVFLQHQVKKDEDGAVTSEGFVLRVMKNQDGANMPEMELQRGEWGLWQLGVQIGGDLAPGSALDHAPTILRLIGEYYARGKYISTSVAPNAPTGVYATLKGDPAFPQGLNRKRTAEAVRDLERSGALLVEQYQRGNRTWAERWAIGRDPNEPFEQGAQPAHSGTQ